MGLLALAALSLTSCGPASPGPDSFSLAIRGDSTAIGSREGVYKVYNILPSLDSARWWNRVAAKHAPHLATFNDGVGGQTIQSMRLKMEADRLHKGWPTVIYDRRNEGESADAYLSELGLAVASLKTEKFLIMPQIRRAEGKDATEVLEIMSKIDIRVHQQWPNNTMTQTEADALRLALSSASTRYDGLHRNARGQAIEADAIWRWINARHWYET